MFYLFIFSFLALIFLLFPTSSILLKVVRIKKYLLTILILFFLTLIIIFSQSAFHSAQEGFKLWVNNVIPSLLPFLVCIELLKLTPFLKIVGRFLEPIMRPLFNIPGAGSFALAMGMSSGYPIGAKLAVELYTENLCTLEESERLLSFTNTSGPIFIISAVGISMFNDSKIGFLLLLTHILSALTVGLIFKNYKKTCSNTMHSIISQNRHVANTNFMLSDLGKNLGISIKNSMNLLLLIGGYIIFFSVICTILKDIGFFALISPILAKFFSIIGLSENLSTPFLFGLIEVTNGIKELSLLKDVSSYICLIPFVALVLGIGGVSICMQISSIIAESKLSIKPYIIGKILQGIFAYIYTYLLMKYTSFFSLDVVETFSTKPVLTTPINIFTVMFFTLVSFVLIYKIYKLIFFKNSIAR